MTGATQAEEFEQLWAQLFVIACRILGSVSEAEDAVQETWPRYGTRSTLPMSTKAFLSATVTRISIAVLRLARRRREARVGSWLPESLLIDPYEDPDRSAVLADLVSMAALLLLEREYLTLVRVRTAQERTTPPALSSTRRCVSWTGWSRTPYPRSG